MYKCMYDILSPTNNCERSIWTTVYADNESSVKQALYNKKGIAGTGEQYERVKYLL